MIPVHTHFVAAHLEMRPMFAGGEVEIVCQGPNPLILFEDLGFMNITSIKFTSCSLMVTNSNNQRVNRVIDYAVVHNCTFYSSKISCLIFNKNFSLYVSATQFLNNSDTITTPRKHGGALSVSNVILFLHSCKFIGNTAVLGGAVYVDHSKVQVNDTTFENNSAIVSGGGIYLLESRATINNTFFANNCAMDSGGALYFDTTMDSSSYANDVTLFVLNTAFTFNEAGLNGGALYCGSNASTTSAAIGGPVTLVHVNSESNSATNGGFAYLSKCHIKVHNNAVSRFADNRASKGGVFFADGSVLDFGSESQRISDLYMSNNIAESKGGAMYLNISFIPLRMNSHFLIRFSHNRVNSEDGKGGAIFSDDSYCQFSQCFLQFSTIPMPTYADRVYFEFSDNEASQGSVLFGGLLDRCFPLSKIHSNLNAIGVFKKISRFKLGPSTLTSEPLKICLCNNSQPNCSLNEVGFSKMRGQSLVVSVAALDQDENPVPSIISASYRETLSAQLKQGENSRQILGRCTDLSYHIYTSNMTNETTLVLESLEDPCRPSLSTVAIRIRMQPCSRGFEQQEKECVCDRRLTEHFGISVCDINTYSIEMRRSLWLQYDENYLKVHANCPLDYCQVAKSSISLSSPDKQCARGRSGVLCGGCAENYSIVLGSSQCNDCTTSKYNFIWLTLLFAVAGMALVALLLVCNMTISHGTLNGLIFYANVVSTSGLTSLDHCSLHPILSVFIAWVNLDFGVETCFYSGMDTYQKTWLQFVFPLYIWLLVGAIIVASYYSSTAMKLFGRNNIALLATLFLLSYSKLLRTIITALSFTQVWRATADNVSDQLVPYKVWTYDGNIEYLKGQHIALFVVAFLVLVLLFLPYTLLLLFGQWIRSLSVKRKHHWILKVTRSTVFISILDAYHAPYKKRHRYWTGLSLLLRCILFLVFATSSTENAILTNMFIVTLVIMGVLITKTLVMKIYASLKIQLLELCFLSNLGAVSATLYYLKGSDSDVALCRTLTASISISFIMFLGIIAYHACLQIRKTKCFLYIKQVFHLKETRHLKESQLVDSTDVTKTPPTSTTVELREQLLESNN